MTAQIVRREWNADSIDGQALAQFHPVLARVYACRGIRHADELDYGLKNLLPYQDLLGIEVAVDLLEHALQQRQRILVVGDFDADGATASALAVCGLRDLGAAQVDYLVPNRFEFGYGLTPEIVQVAARLSPHLLITVDNGISSLEGVQAAHDLGIQVLVTDHHLPGRVLPAAEAIVNPNQPDDSFPSKCLSGVGVMFYVLMALRARLRDIGWFQTRNMKEPNLGAHLDLVALGTVADLVPLDRNNRILVEQGLRRIRQGKCRPGIRALLRIAKRNHRHISASDLAFAIAPRLNAAGRLTDMSAGIECLITDDEEVAITGADSLNQLNLERREIEGEMHLQAVAHLEALDVADNSELAWGVCLFDASWHQGVVGILASRIRERTNRPVVVFAEQDASELKGSARSIPGFHIRDALDAIATRYPGLLIRFGGHAMAAGLSLDRDNLDRFRAAFDEQARRSLCAADLAGQVLSDGALTESDLGLHLAQAIVDGGPWGQAFPEPTFDGEFVLRKRRILAERHLKMEVCVPGSRKPLDAIAFNTVDHHWPKGVDRVRLAYRLEVNEFRGARTAQLMVAHVEPVVV